MKMSPSFRKLLIIVLSAAVIFCLIAWVLRQADYKKGRAEYREAEEMAGLVLPDSQAPAPTRAPIAGTAGSGPAADPGDSLSEEEPYNPWREAVKQMDLTRLKELNPDVRGWIWIPNTLVSYPVVQQVDNEYYLNHTFAGGTNPVGSIFMDKDVAGDFSDFNTIIYGHQCLDKSMFGSLSGYQDQPYYDAHPVVYIRRADSWLQYNIFAAYEVSVAGLSYRLKVTDPSAQERVITDGLERSVIDAGITAEEMRLADGAFAPIITLSTCTGHGYETRWVVQAVLAQEG